MGLHVLELIYCMWAYSLLVLTPAWIIRWKPAELCFSHFSLASGSVTVSNDPAWGVNTPDINTTQYGTFLWCILHNNRGSFSYERVALHQESNLRKVDTVFMWSEAQSIDDNGFYAVCLYCINWQDVWSEQQTSLCPQSNISVLVHIDPVMYYLVVCSLLLQLIGKKYNKRELYSMTKKTEHSGRSGLSF